jgi:large subunit ribosomal protein L23
VSISHAIIRYPLITEKNTAMRAQNKYVFEVDLRATKDQIRKAVQELFGVKVVGVTTAITKGKLKKVGRSVGYRSDRKRAIIRLAAGQKIDKFGEV